MDWQLPILVWLSAATFGADGPGLAVPREGQPFLASLAAIDRQWNLTFDAAGQSRRMAASELAFWGQLGDAREGQQLLLGNGSWLIANVARVADQEIVLDSGLCRRTALPRRTLRGILLQSPVDPRQRDQLVDRILSYRGQEDRFWLANGDEMTGRLLATPAAEGVADLFGLASLRVALPTTEGPLTIDVKNVVAAAFARTPEEAEAATLAKASLGFRDGSCLALRDIAPQDDQIELTLTSGTCLRVEARRFYRDVTLIQPWWPDVRYLSDVEPVAFKSVPLLTVSWPLGRDRNVLGGRLRSGGRLFLKGLGMHSTSRVVYDLDRHYRAFQAEMALDDSSPSLGSVTYRVFLDWPSGGASASGWKRAYESSIIRSGQPPTPLAVDLRGAARMALVVDYADRGDVLDHANWLNARLVK